MGNKRYRVVSGFARVDEEETPDLIDFDTALNKASDECYVPIHSTLRAIRVEGNVLFFILTELKDVPEFLGGHPSGQV